ncbi:MAG TPA: EamA family transporter [Candidatus Binatia bacterium]|nr:EamA family transporter [Candidatus Binatia bacterium]
MPQPVTRASEYRASLPAIWSALIAVYLIWGSTYLAIRYAVETMPPFLMAAGRFMVCGGFLYALRRLSGDPSPKALEWRSAVVIGIFLLVGGNGGVVWAEQFVPSSLAALLVATVPLWMVLIDTFRPGGHWPGSMEITGIFIGFSGVILLVRSVAGIPEVTNFLGVGALIFASLAWSIGSLYGRSAKLPSSQLLGTAMEMLAGGMALMVVATIVGEWSNLDLAAISRRSALALVYLTVVGSGAFVAYVWLLRVAPTPLVATYAYVNPLVAVALGYFLAAEPMTIRVLLAAALIIGSVVLVSTSQRQ